jgi:TetR/AcrR family transcriptional repressor of mexJK operon
MADITATKILREGSTKKRADILDAARGLFLEEGFDRTSVDAISARAGVSKRTVYDYFGDKQTLLLSVLVEAGRVLMATIRDAIDEHLADVTDLESSLTEFAVRVSNLTAGSTDYADVVKLLTNEAAHLPGGKFDGWLEKEPEDMVAERFAEFGRAGLLEVPNPRLAADHFIALTIEMTLGGFTADRLSGTDSRTIIVEGVRAFLRAYAPR